MAEKTFDDITERLDEIIAQVRSKDTSLERSLDLFDEAIELGSKAVDMVDSFELSGREVGILDAQEAEAASMGRDERVPMPDVCAADAGQGTADRAVGGDLSAQGA